MALEKAKTEKEAHGEFESEHPGYCGAQDTFYVGNLKGVGRVYPPWVASITMLVCRTYTRVSVFPSRVGMLRSRTGEAGTRRIPTIPSTDRRGATRRTVDASKVWPMRAGHCRLHRGIFAMVPDSVVSLTRSDSWSF